MEKKRLISLPEELDRRLVAISKRRGNTVTGLIKQMLWERIEESDK